MKSPKVTIVNSVRYIINDNNSHNEQTPPISNRRKKNASINKELSKKD